MPGSRVESSHGGSRPDARACGLSMNPQHECRQQADQLHVSVSHSLTSVVRSELSVHTESLVVSGRVQHVSSRIGSQIPRPPRRHALCILHSGRGETPRLTRIQTPLLQLCAGLLLLGRIIHGLQAPTGCCPGLKGPFAARGTVATCIMAWHRRNLQ